MNNVDLIPTNKAIFAQAKSIVREYAIKYPTKIQVTSVQDAERAYKNAIGTSREEELHAEYVDAILTFANYISELRSEATD